jgi:hypothetical protein
MLTTCSQRIATSLIKTQSATSLNKTSILSTAPNASPPTRCSTNMKSPIFSQNRVSIPWMNVSTMTSEISESPPHPPRRTWLTSTQQEVMDLQPKSLQKFPLIPSLFLSSPPRNRWSMRAPRTRRWRSWTWGIWWSGRKWGSWRRSLTKSGERSWEWGRWRRSLTKSGGWRSWKWGRWRRSLTKSGGWRSWKWGRWWRSWTKTRWWRSWRKGSNRLFLEWSPRNTVSRKLPSLVKRSPRKIRRSTAMCTRSGSLSKKCWRTSTGGMWHGFALNSGGKMRLSWGWLSWRTSTRSEPDILFLSRTWGLTSTITNTALKSQCG